MRNQPQYYRLAKDCGQTVTLVSLQKGDNLPVALFILGYQQFMAKSFKDHYTIESTARAEPDSGSLALQKYT